MSEQNPAEYDGELDPRVQEELERLNQSSNQINQLETNLNRARNDYRSLLQVKWPLFQGSEFWQGSEFRNLIQFGASTDC